MTSPSSINSLPLKPSTPQPQPERPGVPGRPALVPVVVQDAVDNSILMLAYADRAALERTLGSGDGWYYSRSRDELWRKGATSGHTQKVVDARLDCDGDAVLLRVEQTGPACHTGQRSCFHRPLDTGRVAREVRFERETDCLAFLAQLESLIERRDVERPPGSYVAGLLESGLSRVLQKVGEEATEFILAAATAPAAGDERVREEAADLLFHLLVGLRAAGVGLAGVIASLEARHGRSDGCDTAAQGTSSPPKT